MPTSAHYELIETAPNNSRWIVLVHGISQDHRLFDRQVELLHSAYRLALIDLPGHGNSAALPGPFGLTEYADCILQVLEAADIDTCHYWGTHLGAGAGLLAACSAPSRFRSLTLESPVFPGRPLPSVSDLLARIAEVAMATGINDARELWWQTGRWFDVIRAHPEACRAAEHKVMIDDFGGAPWLDSGLLSRPLPPFEAQLPTLRMPILIVNGEHDLPDFLDAADALSAYLPNCRRESVADAGGFPLWEFPERVTEVVQDFVARS